MDGSAASTVVTSANHRWPSRSETPMFSVAKCRKSS
jgi:hypothetical protein